MTTSQIKKLLKGFLEELSEEKFKEFQWHLREYESEETQPLTRSRLENTTREETVDELVEAYRTDGAVSTTVNIFVEMTLNDLADKLTKAQIDIKEQQSHEPMSSTESENQRDTPSKNIKEKRMDFEKVKRFCDSSIEHIKSQSCDTEKNIKDKFEELHLFLKKEEETRLAALREEESQKIHIMQSITELSRNTFSLSDTVKEMEDLGVDVSFIQTFKKEMERTQKALPNPHQLPEALINEPKHLENLQLTVLKNALRTIKSGHPLLKCRFSSQRNRKKKRVK